MIDARPYEDTGEDIVKRGFAHAALTLAIFAVAGCASPIKPAVLDTSGPKVQKVAVKVQFHNSGGNPRLKPEDLASEFFLAMERQAPRVSEGRLTVVRAPAAATHLVTVDATLLSRTSVQPGYWDSCMYQSKDGHCRGGMQPDTTSYTRVRLHLQVVDRVSGATVFRSDDAASGKVVIDDRAIDRAAEDSARATLKALKDSGLI